MRLLVALICFTSAAWSQTRPLLRITSPASGTVVAPGQTVVISVAADPSVSKVFVVASTPGDFFAQGPDAYGRFSLTIPAKTRIGQYKVTACGPSSRVHDLEESEPITLAVENPLPIVKLQTPDTFLHFDEPEGRNNIRVMATFSDGSVDDVSRSIHTTYESENGAIAQVDAQGLVTAVAPGHTHIIVAAGRLKIIVDIAVDAKKPPVTVKPEQKVRCFH